MPFAWGAHDCLQHTSRCVRAMTGIDFAALYAPYHDEAGALALLAAHGGVQGILTAHLGAPIPDGLARDGDVVAADLGHGPTAGVQLGVLCYFAGSFARPGLVYLQPKQRGRLIAAWRV